MSSATWSFGQVGDDDLLTLTAAAEHPSKHPVARAIVVPGRAG
jgi:cation transport ATPase